VPIDVQPPSERPTPAPGATPPPANVPISRKALPLSLALLVAFIAGCGSSSSSNAGSASITRPATGTPIGNPGQHSAPPVRGLSARTQFRDFAQAVNLRPADVPDFIAEPRKPRQVHLHNRAFEENSQYERCFSSRREAKPLLKSGSDRFKAGEGLHLEEASSAVEIAPTIAVARRELAEERRALQSESARRCLARAFDRLGTQGQAFRVGRGSMRITVGNLRLAPMQLGSATSGTDGSAGFSMSMSITYTAHARGRTFRVPASLHIDHLAFLVGRAGVNLNIITLGASFPPELEATLFSRLVSRALTAAHAYPSITRES
jgi:hypothetical protein